MALSNYFKQNSGWIKILSSIGGGIIGVVSLLLGYLQWQQQNGGNLTLQINGRTMSGYTTKNIAICIDSANTSFNFPNIYPVFYNPEKYSVHDFMLQYRISSRDIQFEHVEMYSLSSDGDGSYLLRYNNNKLAPYESSVLPIRKFLIPDYGGKVNINVQASYDGADSLMQYDVAAHFFVVSNNVTSNFDEWKEICQDVCNKNMDGSDYDAFFVSSRFHSQDYQYNHTLVATNKSSAETRNNDKKADNIVSTTAEQKVVVSEISSYTKPSVPLSTSIEHYFESVRSTEYTSQRDQKRHSGLTFKFREEYKNDTVYVLLLAEDTVSHRLTNKIWEVFRIYGSSDEVSHLLVENEIVKGYDICTVDGSLGEGITISEDYHVKNSHNEPVAVTYNTIRNNSDKRCHTEILAPKSEGDLLHNDTISIETGSIRYLRISETYITDDLKPKSFTDPLWKGLLIYLGFWLIMGIGYPLWSRIEDGFDALSEYGWKYAKGVWFDFDAFVDDLKEWIPISLGIIIFVAIICFIIYTISWFI